MVKDNESARSSASAVKSLNEALGLLRKANLLLDKVQAGWSVPDAPEQPPMLDLLKTIGAQGTHAADLAKQLQKTMKK